MDAGGIMVRYEEVSQFDKDKLFLLGLSIVALMVWLGIEIQSYMAGKPSFLGIAYIILFFCLLLWRYGVRYSYILTNQDLIVTSQILHYSRTFTIALNLIESYSNEYKGSLFKRTGISRFVHRYSTADSRMIRILIFTKKGKTCGLLLKVSDRFMNELRVLHPKIYEKM